MSGEGYGGLTEACSRVVSSSSTNSFIHRSEGGPTFQRFLELPVEIQNQIWLFALSDPRIVEIRKKWGTMAQGSAQHEFAFFIADPIPLLHTCRNSRCIALKTYSLAFSSQLANPAYFDKTRDTVLMSDLNVLKYVLNKRCGSLRGDSVRHFAIDPTTPLNINPGVSLSSPRSRAVYDIPNDGVSFLSEAIMRYSSLSELLILYPVEENAEIPVWFENGVVDLLEEAMGWCEFDLENMPQIISLAYQADEGSAGKWKAVRDWMASESFKEDCSLRSEVVN